MDLRRESNKASPLLLQIERSLINKYPEGWYYNKNITGAISHVQDVPTMFSDPTIFYERCIVTIKRALDLHGK